MAGIPSRKTCTSPWGPPEQFAEYAAKAKHHAQEAGRDPASIDFTYSASWYNDQEAERLPNGARRPVTGTPAQIVDDIKCYEEVGVRHMMLSMVVRRPGVTVQQSLERMERFATKVMPLV
jgi:alkanesulfonate monooxygenase SsuD/methylene tetrahydromethanopterin reductase-like flavin-dependent oxidoreductase (luciferase family)